MLNRRQTSEGHRVSVLDAGGARPRGASSNIGYELDRSTIQRVLAEHGLEPAPRRERAMSWKTRAA
jgi:hypothetical protein